jgi:hypothetical protein
MNDHVGRPLRVILDSDEASSNSVNVGCAPESGSNPGASAGMRKKRIFPQARTRLQRKFYFRANPTLSR